MPKFMEGRPLKMALSKQITPTKTLDRFLAWAVANGYSVGENPRYGTKRVDVRVHKKGSWHADGLAADLNKGPNGPNERAWLLKALRVANALGLAATYARDGVVGSAANHQTHLHVDPGEWSNFGKGLVRPPKATIKTIPVKALQKAVGGRADDAWGADTDKRLKAVRAASNRGGRKFPYGVAYTQRVVRTPDDNKWGAKSRKAHDKTVAAIQRALGVNDDGIWGGVTDSAYNRARTLFHIH